MKLTGSLKNKKKPKIYYTFKVWVIIFNENYFETTKF